MMIGKRFKIFFDDGEKVSWKEGKVSDMENFGVWIDNVHIIPYNRIIRMEVMR